MACRLLWGRIYYRLLWPWPRFLRSGFFGRALDWGPLGSDFFAAFFGPGLSVPQTAVGGSHRTGAFFPLGLIASCGDKGNVAEGGGGLVGSFSSTLLVGVAADLSPGSIMPLLAFLGPLKCVCRTAFFMAFLIFPAAAETPPISGSNGLMGLWGGNSSAPQTGSSGKPISGSNDQQNTGIPTELSPPSAAAQDAELKSSPPDAELEVESHRMQSSEVEVPPSAPPTDRVHRAGLHRMQSSSRVHRMQSSSRVHQMSCRRPYPVPMG